MRVLSLFSGVGGMDLGLERAGHQIVGLCEIDRHARSVLRRHHPDAPIHDDVTTLEGEEWRGRVDVVAGGSPCQDLSVAGRRNGLDGARSGLFWHQCRIADTSAAPWIIWENVVGALSSSGGADFASVLWGLTGTHPRLPDGERWKPQGVIVGPKRWAVWRVLDAQWFGVPQRRRRVFVVAGPRGICRPEILLEPQGMFGDSPTRSKAEQEVAGTLGTRPQRGDLDNHGAYVVEHVDAPMIFDDCRHDPFISSEITSTLTARMGTGGNNTPMAFVPCVIDDDRRNGPSVNTEVTPTLTGRMGTGGNNTPMAFVKAKRARSEDDDESWQSDRPAPTLNQFDNGHETRATVLAVPVAIRGRDGGATAELGEPELANTLRGSDGGGSKQHVLTETVRRLTPRECERLMGWPDDWTRWDCDGNEQADSHRYKQCGNGVVAPVTEWIGRRLLEVAG